MTSPEVVVFGAGGFLVRQMLKGLSAAGMEGVGVSRRAGASYQADVTDAGSLEALPFNPAVIINAAASVPDTRGSSVDLETLLRTNALGAANVAHWAAQRGTRRIVHCSTLSVVQRPWPVPLTEESVALPEWSRRPRCGLQTGGRAVSHVHHSGSGL